MSKQHPHIKTLRTHNKFAELAQKFIEAAPNSSGEFYERLESAIKEGR